MKTKLLYLAALVLGLTGCLELGTDSDDATPDKVCQLTTSTTSITNSYGARYSYSLNYTYNENGQLATIASPDTMAMNIRFTYDAQNRLIREQSDSYTWASDYNHKNQLVLQTRTFEFAPGRSETLYLSHQYNNNGDLVQSIEFVNENGEEVPLYTYRYNYSNGNMSGIEKIAAQDSHHYLAVFTTDASKTPLPAIPMHMLYLHRDETLPIMGMLPHNMTSFTVLHSEGEGESGFKTFTAAITYNQAGQATTTNRTYTSGATENTTYTYSCE